MQIRTSISMEMWKELTAHLAHSRYIEYDVGGYPIAGILSDEFGNDAAAWGPWYEEFWVIINGARIYVSKN